MVEARALRDGLNLAIQAGFKQLIVEGDSKTVIHAFKGKTRIPWRIYNIVNDIHTLRMQGILIITNYVFKEANMASYRGHFITRLFSSDLCFSLDLRLILAKYLIGCTFVKRGA